MKLEEMPMGQLESTIRQRLIEIAKSNHRLRQASSIISDNNVGIASLRSAFKLGKYRIEVYFREIHIRFHSPIAGYAVKFDRIMTDEVMDQNAKESESFNAAQTAKRDVDLLRLLRRVVPKWAKIPKARKQAAESALEGEKGGAS